MQYLANPLRPVLGALLFLGAIAPLQSSGQELAEIDYQQHVAPILKTYCAGCHNDTELEGEFSVSSFDNVLKGTPEGAVIVAGQPDGSKLLQLVLANDDSQMPPEDEPRPSAEEVELLRKWIEQGAQGAPATMSLSEKLKVPQLPAAREDHQYVGAACLVDDHLLAVGSLGSVELRDISTQATLWKATDLPGKVNSLRLSADGAWLIASGGIAGLGGEVTVLDARDGKILRRLRGHADSVYCASISGDGKWIASGSYDRKVILWDATSGEPLREFTGHNGAIYDLDFSPSSQSLATASGDQTVKLWNVHTGGRLDTFGQPEGEMLCVRFSADGQFLFAGGADRQIRKWHIVSHEKPSINPMVVARFAHESEVLQLQLLGDDRLASSSRDRQIKLWNIAGLEPLGVAGRTADVPVALSVSSEGAIEVVELTGARQRLSAEAVSRETQSRQVPSVASPASSASMPRNAQAASFQEQEPNDALASATPIELPAEIEGLIAPVPSATREDADLYSFQAQAGQAWIIEVKAARDQSKLDSRIDILDAEGRGVVRTRLQAVRESYFTFRGKDSNTIDDFRLHKWEDMELDEYLYSSGEVVRLWLYPRGPDSGFKVYPGAGSRNTYFDTTPVAHALGEPAYVVRELQPDEDPLPNGLPVFPIYYENDDDSLRRFGTDSRLTFVPPATGKYFLRVRDARGFGGPEHRYQVSVRAPQPDFTVAVNGPKLDLSVGSGSEWSMSATRLDGFDGPIAIQLQGLPEGLIASEPLRIEAGQIATVGTIYATDAATALLAGEPAPAGPDDKTELAQEATAEAPAQDKEQQPEPRVFEVKVLATGEIRGETVTHELPTPLTLSIKPASGLRFEVVDARATDSPLQELTIHPGETVSARILLERNGAAGPISFGNEDSGRGLPHGAFVDNIGLNGLLIPAEQNEREFFITAAKKVAPGRYPFHLRSTTAGNPTSRPIWLNVLGRD